ncbi:MAG: DUF1501 domain-containing protein [Verrucomicrobia bacterium]|nr:DUF1501 domain-containing protein [Verrucomicrobiota bacterium]
MKAMNSAIDLKTRREFLRTSLLGGAFTWTVPSFVSNTFSTLHAEAADRATQITTGKDGRLLVVLQMAGGNDGLNTVAPFTNDHYFRARPRLKLAADAVLKLNDDFGFHPGLAGLKELFDAANLTVIQGVGYPNPNRSHFRSTEIWQTASDANKFEKHGWLGRYFDNACRGSDPTVGVNIGRQMPQAFASAKPVGVSLDSPENYRFADLDRPMEGETASSEPFYRKLNRPAPLMELEGRNDGTSGDTVGAVAGGTKFAGSPLDYLERVALDAQVSSDKILAISKKAANQATYPASPLANSLKLIARLIGGGLPTRVFYASQGGYDTHTNQTGTHERLLKDMADSVKAFVADLKAQGNFERVLIMTFSEFGRRVAENANGGTDHGAAAPMFVIGDKIKAGFLGSCPSLAPEDLVNGDLKFTVDFRSVYAGVLEGWLNTPSAPVLGRKFAAVGLV